MQFNASSLFEIFLSKEYTVEPVLSILKIFEETPNISTDIVFLNKFLSKYNRVKTIQSAKNVPNER